MIRILNTIKWAIVFLLVIGLAFLIYAGVKITKPLKTSGEEKIFAIPVGKTSRQVAADLEAQELISNAFFFDLYIYFKKIGDKIQAGTYTLSPSMSITEIALKLTGGEVVSDEVRVTVIEGWNVKQIAQALDNKDLEAARNFDKLRVGDFSASYEFLADVPRSASLEGFLFPDTYLIPEDSDAEAAAKKMLDNFDEKLTPDLRKKISGGGQNIYEIVTLASIIEKEVGRNLKTGTKITQNELDLLQEERRQVASVFYNRLRINMALESDATISYVTGRSGSSRATLEETRLESPYNTYKYPGLPPGPIASPSLEALLAAIEPADTDYLFFLTAPDGTAYFARTLEEHIANREQYLD